MNLLDTVWTWLSDADNRDTVNSIFGGAVILVSAAWTLLKRPLWWEALGYLSALKSDRKLSDSTRLRRIFKTKQANCAASLFDVLKGYIRKRRQVLIWGAPGSGKTVTLMALAHCMAGQAFWFRIILWFVIPLIILLLASFLSWWLGLILFGVPLINLLVSRYFPLPIFVELRNYETGPFDEFLKVDVRERVGGCLLEAKFQNYQKRGSFIWLLMALMKVETNSAILH